MILVDTSIWIDHLHRAEPRLVALLEAGEVGVHPMVVGELAVGRLRDRVAVLAALDGLWTLAEADSAEVRQFVERRALHGRGLSWVDVHLLASVLLAPGVALWTRDRRLRAAAKEFGVGYAA